MAATGELYVSSPSRVRTENRMHWDLSPKQIQQLTDKFISKTREVYDAVGSLDLDNVTFKNTLKALAHADIDFLILRNNIILLRNMSPIKRLRTASTCAYRKLLDFVQGLRVVILGKYLLLPPATTARVALFPTFRIVL